MTNLEKILNCEEKKNAAFEAVKNALPYVNPAEMAVLLGCLKDAYDHLLRKNFEQADARFENATKLANKMVTGEW